MNGIAPALRRAEKWGRRYDCCAVIQHYVAGLLRLSETRRYIVSPFHLSQRNHEETIAIIRSLSAAPESTAPDSLINLEGAGMFPLAAMV